MSKLKYREYITHRRAHNANVVWAWLDDQSYKCNILRSSVYTDGDTLYADGIPVGVTKSNQKIVFRYRGKAAAVTRVSKRVSTVVNIARKSGACEMCPILSYDLGLINSLPDIVIKKLNAEKL